MNRENSKDLRGVQIVIVICVVNPHLGRVGENGLALIMDDGTDRLWPAVALLISRVVIV